jgi:hypothetical protein
MLWEYVVTFLQDVRYYLKLSASRVGNEKFVFVSSCIGRE